MPRLARTVCARVPDHITRRGNQTLTLDAAGNTLSDGSGRTFSYNAAERLQQAALNGTVVASYAYRANGRRARALMSTANTAGPGCKPKKKPPKKPKPKCAPGVPGTAVYHYDLTGNLIGETTEIGEPITDYVYAGAIPLAQLDRDGLADTLTYLHTDHLNTPRLATDPSGTAVWRWDGNAFGDSAPNQDPDGDGTLTTVNLRYPGQYFDAETGLHYNWHRYYDPKTGRYLTSDPVGLQGGLNTYSYVFNNPLRWVDPAGLGTTINPDGSTTYDPMTPDTIHDWVRQQNKGERCAAAQCGAGLPPNLHFSPDADPRVVSCVANLSSLCKPVAVQMPGPWYAKGGAYMTCIVVVQQLCEQRAEEKKSCQAK
jgi:RHS repeat-associated protein